MAKINSNQTKPTNKTKQQRRRQKTFLSIAHIHCCVFPFLFSSSSLFGLPIFLSLSPSLSLFLYRCVPAFRFYFFLIIFSLYNINFWKACIFSLFLAVFFCWRRIFFPFFLHCCWPVLKKKNEKAKIRCAIGKLIMMLFVKKKNGHQSKGKKETDIFGQTNIAIFSHCFFFFLAIFFNL